MKKVRIGILGCANIARKYAIKSFQSLGNVEVASIASRDINKAQAWAAEFGIPMAETYGDLIDNKEVDAIYIPLPIGLHAEWIIKAAQAGKHVISEKSLTGDLASAKEAIDECKKVGVVLYENFMCDLHPQHQKVLDLIQEDRIGNPTIFRGYFGFPMMPKDNFRYDKKLGGGCLNDAGAYTVFMARKILESEPVAVTATMEIDKALDIDTRGSALLEFKDGKSALVAFDFNAVYQNNYSVWGSRGVINVKKAYSIPPEVKPDIELITNDGKGEKTDLVEVAAANQFSVNFKDFCDTVMNKGDLIKKISERYEKILAQAKVLEAIRTSVKENRKVLISEFK